MAIMHLNDGRRGYHYLSIMVVFLVLPLWMLCSANPLFGSQQSEPQKILLLTSYQPSAPVGYLWNRGIRSILESGVPSNVDLDIEYLDVLHFKDARYVQLLINLLRHKYAASQPDLVITVYNMAFDFMRTHGPDLFPEVPVVFAGVEKEFIDIRKLGPNITGVISVPNYAETLGLALRLHPDTQHVAVVSGAGKIGRTWSVNAMHAFQPYRDRVDFIDITGLPMPVILEKVATLPQQSLVMYITLLEDGAGNKFTARQSASQISRVTNAPVYSFWDLMLGHGIVGGYLSSAEEKGKAAAALALRILNGEQPSDIPLSLEGSLNSMFDWRELKRWSIKEDLLPLESIIKFKELGSWEKYQSQIIVVLALILFQTLIISYLLYQYRIRRKIEQKYRTVADFTYDWEYWANVDGTLEYVSPSCERISGYSLQDIMDNPALIREIIVPQDIEIWDEHYCSSGNELKPHEIQLRIQRRDGETRWIEHVCQPVVDSKGSPAGFRASNRDITERKQAELELQGAYAEITELKEQLETESAYLQEEIKLEHNFENIIGQSEGLKYILYQVEQVAATDSSVLILGETGTGKELVARAIHKLSSRSNRVLVKVNCAALPAELIESELFGREKGAFTGATTTQIGRFELAKGSTILLDEIGELPLTLQAKLLRVLESGEFERLGSPKTLYSDARIITLTNRVLEEEVRQSRFREDLWYRLKVFTVTLPPLRQRNTDIPLLIKWFMDQLSKRMGKPAVKIPKHTIQALQDYHWPGNVRELKNIIESTLITGQVDKLRFDLLPKASENQGSDFKTLDDMERDYILLVLKAKNWKIQGANSASSVLGMNPNTLRARIKKLGIKKLSA